ncbi:hypothetical protein NKI79_22630 [Mesorhizobium sp. M0340]|uniref:hypothetical protein n=1 Tax=Mesorhizobium sp. M0340 TaxID=2956939 RepID=UPI00333C7F1C
MWQVFTRRGLVANAAIVFHEFCETVGEGEKKREDNRYSDGHGVLYQDPAQEGRGSLPSRNFLREIARWRGYCVVHPFNRPLVTSQLERPDRLSATPSSYDPSSQACLSGTTSSNGITSTVLPLSSATSKLQSNQLRWRSGAEPAQAA